MMLLFITNNNKTKMGTMPRLSGDESPPNIPNNTSTDTLPYFSPIAVRSHSPLAIANRSTPLVSNVVNNSYTIEPIAIPTVDETTTCDKSMILMTTFHIVLAVLALTLPITVLIMTGIYGNDMQCYPNNTVPVFDHVNLVETIGLKTWLNVFGAFGIINNVVYFSALLLFVRKYSNSGLTLLFTYIAFSMFRFAWIIVGCFLLWRDCLGTSRPPVKIDPPQMNGLMWASILISIFFEVWVIIGMIYNGYKIYTFTKPTK